MREEWRPLDESLFRMRPLFVQECVWERPGAWESPGLVHADLYLLRSVGVMWARESHTVAPNWARAKAGYEMAMQQLSILPERLLPQLAAGVGGGWRSSGNVGGIGDTCNLPEVWQEFNTYPVGHHA